jgi:hypothetical protein
MWSPRKMDVTDQCTGSVHSSLAGHLEEVALLGEPCTVVAWICTGCGAVIYNDEWLTSGASAGAGKI